MKIKQFIKSQIEVLISKLRKVGYKKLAIGFAAATLIATTGVSVAFKAISNPDINNTVQEAPNPYFSQESLDAGESNSQAELASKPSSSVTIPPTLVSTPTPTSQQPITATPDHKLTPTPKSESTNAPSPTSASNKQVSLKADFKATGFRNTSVFTYTTQIFKGDTVNFDASESTGNIVAYEWNFGDGTTGVGKITSHSYNTDLFNNYNVKLTVKDNSGQTNTTGGYYIHYIGEPRMLISVEPVPEANERKYVCGQTIRAKAKTYSPYGEITQLEWELMRGAISSHRDSDKSLITKTTDKNGTIEYTFSCGTILEDAVLQDRDRNAVYSFVVRKMKDSAGNELIYSNSNYYGGIGSVAIVVYNP